MKEDIYKKDSNKYNKATILNILIKDLKIVIL